MYSPSSLRMAEITGLLIRLIDGKNRVLVLTDLFAGLYLVS